MTTTKEAQRLHVGDRLASGGVVTSAPTSGINTPRGKVELAIDGYGKVWNRRTIIQIITES